MNMKDRLPVVDQAAERGAVGAMLLDAPRIASFARGVLKLEPEAWYEARCQSVVRAIYALLAEAQYVDPLTVAAWLARELGEETRAEWFAFCVELTERAVTPAGGPAYCEMVRAGALTRGLEHAAMEVWEKCGALPPPAEVDDFIAWGAERVAAVAKPRQRGLSNEELLAELEQAWRDATDWRKGDESKKPAMGVPTPWGWLTEKLCGLERGSMLVVGGRPSAGKTTLEDCLVEHALAVEKEGVALRWTMDSSRRELLARALCRNAEVSMPKMKQGYGRLDQHEEVRAARARIAADRMFFFEGSDMHSGLAWIRAMAIQHKVVVVTVDYVQQVQLTNERGFRADNENARLTIVSGALKALCLDLNLPLVVLSQMSRDVEKEGRDESRLSDLRSSGAIEQDADKVLFVSVSAGKRKEMEEKDPEATKHKRPVKFEVVKNKNGETGWKPMWLLPPYFKFVAAADPEVREKRNRKGEMVKVTEYWPDDVVALGE